jgi:chromosome segregation ATPase
MATIQPIVPSSSRWVVQQAAKTKKLKDRCSPIWRVVPGLLALISTIIAVICALIWNSPYLSLAFAPGAIASLYLIYLGWDFGNLKTFSENNDHLEHSIINLKQEVNGLQKENECLRQRLLDFSEENNRLKNCVDSLETVAEDLGQEKVSLSVANQQLEKTVKELEKLKQLLEERGKEHVNQLAAIAGSFSVIKDAVANDHERIAQHVDRLGGQVEQFKSAGANLEAAGLEFERQAQLQVAGLLEAVKGTLDEWKKWINNDEVREQRIQKEELQKSLQELKSQIAVQKAVSVEQEAQINRMREIQEASYSNLQGMANERGYIHQVHQQIADTAEKMTQGAGTILAYASSLMPQGSRY